MLGDLNRSSGLANRIDCSCRTVSAAIQQVKVTACPAAAAPLSGLLHVSDAQRRSFQNLVARGRAIWRAQLAVSVRRITGSIAHCRVWSAGMSAVGTVGRRGLIAQFEHRGGIRLASVHGTITLRVDS
jgi:hypothetical protein